MEYKKGRSKSRANVMPMAGVLTEANNADMDSAWYGELAANILMLGDMQKLSPKVWEGFWTNLPDKMKAQFMEYINGS